MTLAMTTVMCFSVGSLLTPSSFADSDPIRSKLEESKTAFQTNVDSLKKSLSEALQAKIDEVRKKGERESVLQLTAEKERLESKGALPKGVPVDSRRDGMRKALEALEGAYDQAIKKYTQLGEDAKAGALVKERREFLESFGPLATIGLETEEEKEAKTAKGKSVSEVALDPWGRWHRFPGDNLGPRWIIWQDDRGFHVRILTNKKLRKFDGAIRVVEGKLTSLTGTDGLEPRGNTKDSLSWNDDRDQIAFNIRCKGGEDGFDFQVSKGATRLRCAVKVDAYEHTEWIYVGNSGEHPKHAEFALKILSYANPKK